jgi:hypothetical protein
LRNSAATWFETSKRVSSGASTPSEDLYDEFNFGVRGPEAIRAFLQSAAQWKIRPRWVLLVGDASIDPRNYMGIGAFDFVPTKLVPTVYLKTASDDWLADVNGDGVPDFAIGRIPVRTAQDAALVGRRPSDRLRLRRLG